MHALTEVGAADIEAVRVLLRLYAKDLAIDLAYQRFEEELQALPQPYTRPRGLLLAAKVDGRVVGVAAYRPIAEAIAEVKRMYVLPLAQGRGLGKALLRRLIDEAGAAGYAFLRLDTHRPSMAAAIGLYRSLGFKEIDAYGPNPIGEIAFFEKSLHPGPTHPAVAPS